MDDHKFSYLTKPKKKKNPWFIPKEEELLNIE